MIKIAIKGHKSRGKEIIQILESLGGKNTSNHNGKDNYAYYISSIDNRIYKTSLLFSGYKHYTLEEFEKEFPFKIGDKIKHITSIGSIKEYRYINNEPAYRVESMELGISAIIPAKILEPYKEMEIRNITLTLDKAKEWYKKGGELKEVALQAYSEEELTKVELPKTWEEFCDNYPIKGGECWIGTQGFINVCKTTLNKRECRNWIPSKKSAEAHIALMQLEQLRDCYRRGWIPNWYDDQQTKYCVVYHRGDFKISVLSETNRFLSFPTYEMTEKFIKCFGYLIEKAGDLI